MRIKLVLCIFLIYYATNKNKVAGYKELEVNGVQMILALENEMVRINCKSDNSLSYCGFIHPNGTRYSFSGLDLKNGVCSMQVNASKKDVGEWICHIGTQEIGMEIERKIIFRIEDHLAAVEKNVTAIHGREVTLYCTAIKGRIPLSYCRFEPPNGIPFSMGSAVSIDKPLAGKYYFPKVRSLDRGDCSVTIRRVKYEDAGPWICGAEMGDGKEYIDVINLNVEGLYAMSTASTTGITIGIVGIVVFLAVLGVVAWRKRHMLGHRPQAEAEVIEVQELGRVRIPRSPQRIAPEIVETRPEEPEFSTSH